MKKQQGFQYIDFSFIAQYFDLLNMCLTILQLLLKITGKIKSFSNASTQISNCQLNRPVNRTDTKAHLYLSATCTSEINGTKDTLNSFFCPSFFPGSYILYITFHFKYSNLLSSSIVKIYLKSRLSGKSAWKEMERNTNAQ